MPKDIYFVGTEIKRDDIKQLIIETSRKVPKRSWDNSIFLKNRTEASWRGIRTSDKDGLYEMTIGQEGGVVANLNWCYLFCDLSQINGMGNSVYKRCDGYVVYVFGLWSKWEK